MKDGDKTRAELIKELKLLKDERGKGAFKDIIKLKQAEQDLQESESRFRELFNHIKSGVAVYEAKDNGRDFIFKDFNQAAEKIDKVKKEEIIGKSILKIFPGVKDFGLLKVFQEVYKTGKPQYHPFSQYQDKRIVGWRENYVYQLPSGEIVAVYNDITERKQAEKENIENMERYRKLFELESDALILADASGMILEVNTAATVMYGYSREELLSMKNTDISAEPEKTRQAIINKLTSIPLRWHRKKDGTVFPVEITVSIFEWEGRSIHIGAIRDITDRKKAEEKVLYLSYHDQLTGLYNRRFYEEELRRLDTERNFPITLVMLDINGLKLTNDAFGHQAGDVLLKKVADTLKMECRADEIVARIGGDEFVLLLPKTGKKEANRIIERIQVAIAKEKIDQAILSVSVGFAVKKDASDDMTKVFKKAEDGMYRHKLSESSGMRSKTIDLILNSLYEKNHREMLHSKRVSKICEAIATEMNFKKEDINRLRIAGLMHDIGKIGIAENILNKVEKLNSNEWDEMERHSEIGYRILSSVNEFLEIVDYVLEHHERWDGKGYPRGLKEEGISLPASIIALADSYDAMTSDRSYKKRLSEEEAIDEIRRCSGEQFNPEIVKVFIEKVLEKVR